MEKVPFQITAKKNGKVARINIIGEIGWQIDATKFSTEVAELVKQGCTEAHLYINSIGGNCFDANEIANILEENFTKVTGDGGAIVASAAAFIAAKCETFTMPSNGQFMIHRPRGGSYGTAKDIEAYLKMIVDIDADYLKVFKAKATNPENIQQRWDNNSDYWMNAKDAEKEGFVTSIREKVKPDKQTTSMLRSVAATVGDLKDRMSEFLINDDTNMETLNALLKLPKDANEDARMEAINSLLSAKAQSDSDLQAEKDKNTELQGKLDAIELKEKETATAENKALIAEAIKDGRLDDDENHTTEATWLKFFDIDREGTKAQLERLPKKTSLKDRIETGGDGESAWEKRQREIAEKNAKK